MATSDIISPDFADALRARFERAWARWAEQRARRRIYRETYRELARLTDRELADLGIARANIGAVAYEAAHGEHQSN